MWQSQVMQGAADGGAMDSLIRYFDLFARYRQAPPEQLAQTDKSQPTLAWQMALFGALTAGILAKGVLEFFGGRATTWVPSWARLIVCLIAAVVAFPGAYKKTMDESGPGFVQLCVTFTIGLGVKTLFDV